MRNNENNHNNNVNNNINNSAILSVSLDNVGFEVVKTIEKAFIAQLSRC